MAAERPIFRGPGGNAARHRTSGMLQVVQIRLFTQIDAPFDACRRVVEGDISTWLPEAVTTDAGARTSLSHVGLRIAGFRIAKQVLIEVGDPSGGPVKAMRSLTWRATGAADLFPTLEGLVEVAPFTDTTTLLAVMVDYEPPLGAVGDLIDDALLHRLALATLRDFSDRVRDRVGDQVGALVPTGNGAR